MLITSAGAVQRVLVEGTGTEYLRAALALLVGEGSVELWDIAPGPGAWTRVPPCSATSLRQTKRPNPVPCGLVVKYGWKSRPACSGATPQPSSRTATSRDPS